MPYPVVHVLFFVLGINAIAIYAILKSAPHSKLTSGNVVNLLLLLFVGSLCSIFPDIIGVYNLLVNGTTDHCWIGPVPTHSLLFSSSAILFGILIGYITYRKVVKTICLGLLGAAAFFSHLLLDDARGISPHYFYPVYNERFLVSPLMDVSFQNIGFFQYLITSIVSIFFFFFVITIALFALNKLGFKFEYIPEK